MRLLPEEAIDTYVGVDHNEQLLEQGKSIFSHHEKVSFCQADFLRGLPIREEPPFDLYLANYGTFSHCKDQELVDLLAEIAVQANDGSLLIADWLGCYCYEWQNLWLPEPAPDYMMSYVISYIYDDPEQAEARAFDLRLMDRETILTLAQKAGEKANAEIKVHQFFDRSLFVGRHIETSHYHPGPQPLRLSVNSLFELGQETDLERLLINYHRRDGFFEVNARFVEFKECWNALVRFTADLLSGKSRVLSKTKKAFLTRAMKAMHLLVENIFSFSKHDLKLEEVRSSIIEPQLAYLLRGLEINLQQGIGMGHGLGIRNRFGRRCAYGHLDVHHEIGRAHV